MINEPPPRDREAVIAEYRLLAKVQEWEQTGRWDRADGPPPFAPGCTVPPELLPKAIRVARKPAPPPPTTAGDLMARLCADVVMRAA